MDKPISLSTLFQKTLFRVPDYQRGYSWQYAQCVDFWEDLINIPKGAKHYTGMVSLQPIEELNDNGAWLIDDLRYDAFYVVDGQQRLTTSIILINTLVEYAKDHKINEDANGECAIGETNVSDITKQFLYLVRRDGINKGFIFGYEKQDACSEYLNNSVIGSSVWDTTKDNYYIKNIRDAKAFFADNVNEYCKSDSKLESAGKLNDLYERLVYSMSFNVYKIEAQEDVFVTFETMNNRGKKLSNLELLKNRLIYLSTIFPEHNSYDMPIGVHPQLKSVVTV